MIVIRQVLRRNFPGIGETPLRSGKSPAQLYLAPVLLIAAMIVGILLSFQPNDLNYRLQIVGLGLALGCLGVALLLWELSVTVGVVRFENHSPTLRFTYAPSLDLLYPLAAVLIMIPAIVALFALLRGEPAAEIGLGRRTANVLGILGFVLFAQQLWALRVPRGLELTSEGVRGVRGAGRIALNWDVLDTASAMSTRTGAKLGLHLKSGEVHVLPRRLIGSDPDAVAAIINYYLRHPADRNHLATPELAIQLVARSS
ncbi:murein endopeptidase [Salinibacterium sp. PAMC 21357]|uniref:murein endopeptidase n=1 Tax=Salinibacterium sp. PAMC 21357 TaxID=1112215 RepID=UPI0002890D37|nr:murein endopeptidase [Salinibacterium sp. PAMC 21357]